MSDLQTFADYTCYYIEETDLWQRDMLIGMLSTQPFETFEETDTGIKAYLPSQLDQTEIEHFVRELAAKSGQKWTKSLIKGQNWNQIWETSFKPIIMEHVVIRAPFHDEYPDKQQLVIHPGMAFGTGHHETTQLMIRMMDSLDMKGTNVLDLGTGTGVLAIYAAKCGASSVTAIDYDPVCAESTTANCVRNGISNVEIIQGDVQLIAYREMPWYQHGVHLLLANINRGVIEANLAGWTDYLAADSTILLSGILDEDKNRIYALADRIGLVHKRTEKYNKWIAIQFSVS